MYSPAEPWSPRCGELSCPALISPAHRTNNQFHRQTDTHSLKPVVFLLSSETLSPAKKESKKDLKKK